MPSSRDSRTKAFGGAIVKQRRSTLALFPAFLVSLLVVGCALHDEPMRVLPEAVLGSSTIPTGETVTYTYLPAGEGPFPALLYLQGYPCRSAAPDDDKNLARNKLLASMVDAGFLVHLAEKPGLGGGRSNKACSDLLYKEEVTAFAAVLDGLLERTDIDQENVFIFGHSMGGQTAPLIARGRNVRGIITYGIHAKPWCEFMIDIARAQSERLGMDPVVADAETATMIPFLYDLMIAKDDWSSLQDKHKDALSIGIFRAEGELLNGRHHRFWSDLNDAPFITSWAEFGGDVLSIYGEYDIASISAEGAGRIANVVNYHHPGRATSLILPKTGHGFARVEGSFEDYQALRFEPNWAGGKEASYFNPELADEVVGWLLVHQR